MNSSGWKFFVRKVIGEVENPLMIRWILVGTPWGSGIYVHKFLRSDHDSALHDHPWNFVAIVLKGGYFEHYSPIRAPFPNTCFTKCEWRGPGSILHRPAIWKHRVELPMIANREEGWEKYIYSWSLVFVGRRRQPWGFWVPDEVGNTTWCWHRKYDLDTGICSDEILYTEGED